MNFEYQLEKGNRTEILIESVLQNYGWYTIPTYDYRGEHKKSPRAICGNDKIVLPDLDCSRNGIRVWIEIKHELGATWTYSTGTWEHGFGKYYFDQYLKIQEITQNVVWIFFLEHNQEKRDKEEYIKNYSRQRKYPSIRYSYPKNVLRGQMINKLSYRTNNRGSKARIMFQDYVYFNQNDFLYLGAIRNNKLIPLSSKFLPPLSILNDALEQ